MKGREAREGESWRVTGTRAQLQQWSLTCGLVFVLYCQVRTLGPGPPKYEPHDLLKDPLGPSTTLSSPEVLSFLSLPQQTLAASDRRRHHLSRFTVWIWLPMGKAGCSDGLAKVQYAEHATSIQAGTFTYFASARCEILQPKRPTGHLQNLTFGIQSALSASSDWAS